MSGENSKFSESCEDAESLKLSGQNSGCDLNLDEQNSLKEQNFAASNLSDESSAAALNLSEQNFASALNLDNSNSKTTPNLNNQNFTAATSAEEVSKTAAGAVKTEAVTASETAQNDIEAAEAGAETTRNATATAEMAAEAATKEAEAARPQIQELTNFLSEYTAKILSIGTYTARIERCVRRIAYAYDYEASLMIFVRHFIISVMDPADNSIRRTYVKTGAAAQISFDLISELSALSWEIYDEKIPLARARASFAEILASQKKSFAKTLVLLSVANAAFCELFGGDGGAMALVFAATAFGICARYLLSKLKINLKIQYIAVSFAVSFIVSLGARYGLSATPDVAVGSSILFLIPGVWLINSVFDILNENMLVGISRGLNTGLLIICIAIGLFLTLSISNLGLVNV